MKTINLFIIGLVLCMGMNMSFVQNASAVDSDVALALETDFMVSFKENLGDELFTDFEAAYKEYLEGLDEIDLTNTDAIASQFTLSYLLEHPDFAEQAKEALIQTAVDMYTSDPSDKTLLSIIEKLQENQFSDEDRDQLIEELKEQIEELENLSEEEKKAAQEAIDDIIEQNEKLMDAIADANANLNNMASNIAANADKLKPKQMDPSMIMMMMMMMMMMLMGGGGGGQSGSCG